MGVYFKTPPLTYATLVLNEEFGCKKIIGFLLTCKKGGKRNHINNNNNSMQFNLILYHLCAGTTAAKLITEAAQEHKKNTKIQ
jgi:hypothetical protein